MSSEFFPKYRHISILFQRRGIRCIRVADSRPVRESNCIQQSKPQTLQKSCPIECPIDCEVSPWTAWDKSSCGCGHTHYNLTRKRWDMVISIAIITSKHFWTLNQRDEDLHYFYFRVIITQPSTTGRPCPNALTEVKPCESSPCYKWIKSPWSCDLQVSGYFISAFSLPASWVYVYISTDPIYTLLLYIY